MLMAFMPTKIAYPPRTSRRVGTSKPRVATFRGDRHAAHGGLMSWRMVEKNAWGVLYFRLPVI
jgi:hypothetical protein